MPLEEKLEGVKLVEKIKQIDEENEDIAYRSVISLLGNMVLYAGLGVYSGLINLNMAQMNNIKGLLFTSALTSTPFSYLTTVYLHNEDKIRRLAGWEETVRSPLLKILEKAKLYVGTSVATEATGILTDEICFYVGYGAAKVVTKLLNR